MSTPSLPKVGTPPAPAPLRKIALEEHFGHPIVFMRDSEGRFETRKEAAVGHLGPEYFEVVQERLLDFDTTRLQAMDEGGRRQGDWHSPQRRLLRVDDCVELAMDVPVEQEGVR